MATRPKALHFTEDPEAAELLAADPLALLVGLVLDQQVTVQKAFAGPLELQRRLGRLDAAAIARMEPSALEEVFKQKPAIHRFPGSMAGRVQELCALVANEYGGRAERIWTEAATGAELEARLLALPGFGPMKAKMALAILGKRLGVRPPGWEDVAPDYPTLADVDSLDALATYQANKRAYKAATRAAAQAG